MIWSETGKTVTPTDLELEAAHTYNFKITLNVGEEIKFSVVEGLSWGSDSYLSI